MTIEEVPRFLALFLPFGAAGGLLAGMKQTRCLRWPVLEKMQMSLGFLSDIFFGVAGGLAIFLILPFAPQDPVNDGTTIVRLMAVALLGGWGGPTLLDAILNKTVIQEVAQKAQEANERSADATQKIEDNTKALDDTRTALNIAREQEQHNDKALSLSTKQLNGPPDPPVPDDELFAAIRRTSFTARERIYWRAKRIRLIEEDELEVAYLNMRAANTDDKKQQARLHFDKHLTFMERVAVVFRALTEGGREDDICHLYYSNLGYTLMSCKNYVKAIDALTQAIKIRDERRAGDYPYYEFTRAKARMCLVTSSRDDSLMKAIKADLRRAAAHAETRDAIRRDCLVQGWLHTNGLQETDWLGEAA